MADESDGRMLRAALKYIALGWHVFPLSTRGDVKEPNGQLLGRRVAGGPQLGHTLATNDPARAREWWGRVPNAGIGLNIAKAGLIIPDIDPRNGGRETITRIEREKGSLWSPVVNHTGGGGEHRFFAAPPGLRSAPGRIGPPKGGIDLKYNGYIVLPPSLWAAKLADGSFAPPSARYAWAPGCDPFGGRLDFLGYIPPWVLSGGSEMGVPARIGTALVDVFVEDTPRCGLEDDEIAEYLALIPNAGDDELEYDEWEEVLAGIYHETGGSAQGRQIAYDWSSRAMKHADPEFNKTWPSLDITGKGRAPVTFRAVIKRAMDRKKLLDAEKVKDLREALAAVQDVPALQEVATLIKRTDVDRLMREILMGALREKYKLITGNMMLVGLARDMVRYENPEVKAMPNWLKPWVYCSLDDKWFRRGSNETITTRAFNALNNVHMLTPADILEGRSTPETLASDAATNRFEVPKVHGRMYLPGEAEIFTFQGSEWLNTYTEISHPIVPDTLSAGERRAIARVRDHFAMLVPRDRERELVVSWFAYQVQTLRRPNWALCLQGPEANGKSFIGAMMGAVMGSENVKVLFAQTIQESPFNSWAEGSQITIIEELKQHSQNRHIVLDRLQVLITNDAVEIHKKNTTPYNAQNCTGYVGLTNHRDALPVGYGDTRWFLTASRYQTPEAVRAFKAANPDYFTLLFETTSEYPGALRHWLLNYELSPEFNPRARAPRSIEHSHAANLNASESYTLVEDVIRESTDPDLNCRLLDSTKLMENVAEAGGLVPQTKAVNSVLLSLGYTCLGRFKISGERRRYWTTEPETFSDDLANRAQRIREILADPFEGL